MKQQTTADIPQLNPYQVSLSPRFAILFLASASIACFALGSAARQALFPQQTQQPPIHDASHSLPPLFVAPHKPIPNTRYTAKNYDTAQSMATDMLVSSKKSQYVPPTVNETALDGEEEIHEPAGQHLLIDIEHVDGAFLNSEHHLAQAMIDLVDQSGLTMLSYHCHKLAPSGISCAGVLLESHVSFHTWPVQGVITLDLFTCGPNSLLNLLEDVKTLFAIPNTSGSNTPEEPNMVWAFKRRGFETDEGYTPGISDLGTTLLGVLEFPQKKQISFFQTPYQSVHIYDVLDPRYSRLERRMYLDGVLQARQRGQAAYAEAFVHPALLTHSSPHRITIVGGGDGATLREVLKHSSVQSVQLVEIDQAVAEISQKWLWSQCDDFLEVSDCRQDPRVEEYYQDGFEWFQERYAVSKEATEKQDVIILDVLNPEDDVDFSEVFYDDLSFAQTLYGALEEDGILVAKLGAGPSLEDPPEHLTRARHVATLVANLEQVGFASIKEYEDSHGGMLEHETSSFLVAFKSADSHSEWTSLANEALGRIKLQERLIRTKSGKSPLSYVDAATLQSYQMPSRTSEVMFCRNQQAKGKGNECSELEQTRETLQTCAATMHVPETLTDLLEQRGHTFLGLQTNDLQMTEAYNPFQTRHGFANACASMNAPTVTQSPSLIMTLTPAQEEQEEVAVEPLQADSCDNSIPNLTSKELSVDEQECTTNSAARAVYDAVSP